jgi:hypothetical protein
LVARSKIQDPGSKIQVPRSKFQDPGCKFLVAGYALKAADLWSEIGKFFRTETSVPHEALFFSLFLSLVVCHSSVH